MRYGVLAFALPSGVLACAHTCDAQTFLTEEQALHSLFGNAHIAREQRAITEDDRQALVKAAGLRFPEASFTFLIADEGQRPLGYALVMNEIGKSEPITLMVALNPEHRVIDVLV